MSGDRLSNPKDVAANPDYERAEPRADAMFEALRAFGYSLESAVADLVDNSVFAGARNVWIDFLWDGPRSSITVLDDGRGMDEDNLREAMRPGTISPLDERAPDDLGRFGLGLKTASLSQSRLLTVSSKTAHGRATRVWDLDEIARTRDWLLGKRTKPETEQFLGQLDKVSTGTLVVWQHMDRVVDESDVENSDARTRFHARQELVEAHLGMTFHRFLSAKQPLTLFLHRRRVEPWDPFLERKSEELTREPLEIFGKSLQVRPFILPHRSHLTDAEHERARGPKGWNAQQGFYVYRNRRLIVPGSWLELGFQQEEHFKLARILIDLPNTMDQEWQIDVKKAQARPPGSLVKGLRRIATVTRSRASEVYRTRGQIIRRRHAEEFQFVWEKRVLHNRVYWKLNRKHPIIRRALEASGPDGKTTRTLLELVERTVPLEAIVEQNAEHPDSFGDSGDWQDARHLEQLALDLFRAFRAKGVTAKEARVKVASIEPFDRLPHLLAVLEGLR